MKKYILLSIFILSSFSLMAEDINILLSTEKENLSSSGERSDLGTPSAYLANVELTLLFPLATESQVILIDQDTQSVVYSQSFPSTRDLTIDLAVEGIDDGTYTLRVYAFGKWWIGEFVLENDD